MDAMARMFLKRWAGLPGRACTEFLYRKRGGLGLKSFTKAGVEAQISVIELAARARDPELRRAVRGRLLRDEDGRGAFEPLAIAYALWTRAEGEALRASSGDCRQLRAARW